MPSTAYTLRQRVALVLEASVTAEALVAMEEDDLNHAFLVEQQISPTLLRAAGVTPLQLKAHGTATAAQLSGLGFTALHLLDDEWCDDAVAAYGAPALLDEFLSEPDVERALEQARLRVAAGEQVPTAAARALLRQARSS